MLALFALALAARLLYLVDISTLPTFSTPIVDAQEYDSIARAFAGEGIMGRAFFWQGFFYPLFLGLVYLVSNGSIIAARAIQIVLGSVVCVLVYRAGTGIFGRRAGAAAGVICAVYGPLLYFESELLATGWASFWSVILLLFLLRTRTDASMKIPFLIGLCGGLSVLTRATFLPFLAGAGLWMALRSWRAGTPRARIAASSACIAAGFLLVTLPVASLCRRETGRFTFLPLSGPINLHIGNNPDPETTIMTRPGQDWRELTRAPTVHDDAVGRDDQDHFTNLFTEYVTTQPGHFAKGLAVKAAQFLGTRELPRNQDMYVARNYSAFFSLLVWKAGRFGFPFGVLLPFSLVGIFLERRRIPWPMTLFLILYPLAIVLVFVSARYRAPVIPVLAIPAAAGMIGVVDMLRQKNRAALLKSAAAIVAVAVLASIPGPFAVERYDYEAEMHTLLGISFAKRGLRERAVDHLTEAQRLDPGSVAAHRVLGLVFYEQRRIDAAVEQFERARALDPDSHFILYYLGTALLAQGRAEEGIARLEQALAQAAAAKEHGLAFEIQKILAAQAGKRRPPQEK